MLRALRRRPWRARSALGAQGGIILTKESRNGPVLPTLGINFEPGQVVLDFDGHNASGRAIATAGLLIKWGHGVAVVTRSPSSYHLVSTMIAPKLTDIAHHFGADVTAAALADERGYATLRVSPRDTDWLVEAITMHLGPFAHGGTNEAERRALTRMFQWLAIVLPPKPIFATYMQQSRGGPE